jgi:carbamoyl-phosphate synthase small subunit
MKYLARKKAVLILEDGKVFYGKAVGKIGTTTGEICFNTGMTGYQEIFTDPSYFGQITIMNTAHIGNYGTKSDEIESDSIKINGMVCKNFSSVYSRYGDNTESLEDYFLKNNLTAISDVDTRALVRYIRDKGAMNAIISSDNLDVEELKKQLEEVPSMTGLNLSPQVSTKEPYFYGNESADIKVAVLDLGIKKNILRCLDERGCYMKVFPHNAKAEDLLAWNPDGIFLSNGPGDPASMKEVQEEVRKMLTANLPMFGICLGHQMIAHAYGISTFKMHNGHRGINHPIKNLTTGKCEITSQNHGFNVVAEDVEKSSEIEATHIHLNDDTIAGIRVKDKLIFSVQFHPESSPGPNDSRYLFDQFVENIKSLETV